MRTINASEFKAKCLAILDEVATTGELVTILKRGKPVARLLPPAKSDRRYPQQALLGTAHPQDDLLAPPVAAEDWDAVAGRR